MTVSTPVFSTAANRWESCDAGVSGTVHAELGCALADCNLCTGTATAGDIVVLASSGCSVFPGPNSLDVATTCQNFGGSAGLVFSLPQLAGDTTMAFAAGPLGSISQGSYVGAVLMAVPEGAPDAGETYGTFSMKRTKAGDICSRGAP